MTQTKIPIRYLPKTLTEKDEQLQLRLLKKSARLYKKHIFYTRKRPIKSFKPTISKHIKTAKKVYNVDNISPTKELAEKTGCSLPSLQKIVNKGEGAYFSSGSRPNQTPQSWGIARLASAITGQKAAAVDYTILEEGCDHRKPAFKYAKRARHKYGSGHGTSKKRQIPL